MPLARLVVLSGDITPHFLSAFSPDLAVPGVTEETYAYDYAALECETLLSLHKLVFKPRAAAEGDYLVFSYHIFLRPFLVFFIIAFPEAAASRSPTFRRGYS